MGMSSDQALQNNNVISLKACNVNFVRQLAYKYKRMSEGLNHLEFAKLLPCNKCIYKCRVCFYSSVHYSKHNSIRNMTVISYREHSVHVKRNCFAND